MSSKTYGLAILLVLWAGRAVAAEQGAIPVDQPVRAADLLLRKAAPRLQFLWRMPPEVGLVPPLWREMRMEAERQLDQEQKATRDGERHYEANWTVEVDTPHLLSLLGTIDRDNGAQVTRTYASILWDKTTGRRIRFTDLFTSWREARAVIAPLYCGALKRERAKRLEADPDDEFFIFDCPPIEKQVVTLPSARDGGSEHYWIKVTIAAGVVGSRNEDDYETSIFLEDNSLLELIRPEYRADLTDKEDE